MAIVTARSILFEKDYRPLFSGHETFPLRQGWLKKVFDAVSESEPNELTSVFLASNAIARFGVGKNMVTSLRHWALHSGVIADSEQATEFADFLFGADGRDPYLENPASLWLLHWKLCSGESGRLLKTTWFWAFNHFTPTTFVREDLVDGLMKLATSQGWPRLSPTTVQRDVECFVRTYEGRPTGGKNASIEDGLESALSELGLIRGHRGRFQLVRGPKQSLPDGVFAYALNSFWERHAGALSTLSFEACAHAPGSPGRVFLLDESELASRLSAVEEATDGRLRWSETAGLKQLVKRGEISAKDALGFARTAYAPIKGKATR